MGKSLGVSISICIIIIIIIIIIITIDIIAINGSRALSWAPTVVSGSNHVQSRQDSFKE
jgi:hypothetical protein